MTDQTLTLYRVHAAWANHSIDIKPGQVVELNPEQAREILIDAPGGIAQLDAETGVAILSGLDHLAEATGVPLRLDWRPDPACHPADPRGGQAMSTTDTAALRRG